MRYLNLQNSALISLFVGGFVAAGACSSGSDPVNPTPTAVTSTTGAAGSSGMTSSTTSTTSSGGGSNTTSTTSSTTGSTTGAGGAGAGGTGSGTGGTGGMAGPSVCDGAGTRILALTDKKVDDFEGPMISLGWSSFNDVLPTMNSFKIMQEAGGAVGTGHFGHYMGTGARTPTGTPAGFGVGIVYNTAIDTAAMIYCIDITAFDGVSFYAKAATDMAKVGVNFVVPATNMKATDPTLGGGDCTTACYNHPAKSITLTTAWQPYHVTFAEAVSTTGTRVHNVIQQLAWLSPDSNWDFSLDEIQFYKGTPPTGPVASDGGP